VGPEQNATQISANLAPCRHDCPCLLPHLANEGWVQLNDARLCHLQGAVMSQELAGRAGCSSVYQTLSSDSRWAAGRSHLRNCFDVPICTSFFLPAIVSLWRHADCRASCIRAGVQIYKLWVPPATLQSAWQASALPSHSHTGIARQLTLSSWQCLTRGQLHLP
jgi:hypothetical protein